MQDHELDERWARLQTLLNPFHDQAAATCRRLCRSADDGDELYQEAVLRAFNKLHTLRDEDRFRSWFYAVLLSVHRTRFRRSFWRWFTPLDSLVESGWDPPGEDGRRSAGARLRADRVARGLARLPAVMREALVLFEMDGFSVEEIAQLQGVTASAVKSRLSRGRERLRRHVAARESSRGWSVRGGIVP